MYPRNYILFFFIVWAAGLCSQNRKLDSLLDRLQKSEADSLKLNTLIRIGNHYMQVNSDSSAHYHTRAKNLAWKLKDKLKEAETGRMVGWDRFVGGKYEEALYHLSEALKVVDAFILSNTSKDPHKSLEIKSSILSNIGVVYLDLSNYAKALDQFVKALEIDKKNNNKKGQAVNFRNIAIVHIYQGNYPEALSYSFDALKLTEETGNIRNLSGDLGNIGLIYWYQGDLQKALDYYFKAVKIDEELNDLEGQATNYSNIGLVYTDKKEYTKALENLRRSLLITEKINFPKGKASILISIGNIFKDEADLEFASGAKPQHLAKYDSALHYYFNSLEMFKEMDNKKSVGTCLTNIGAIYLQQTKYAKAEEFIKNGYALGKEVNSFDNIMQSHQNFSHLYEVTNRHALALKHYKLLTQYKDSITNEESTRKSIQQEYKFNYEKKFAADSVAFAKEKKIKEVEIEKQQAELKAKRNQQYALFGGLALVLIFSFFMYNRFKVTQKQKAIIEQQKQVVEEKQKEIVDSIRYAKRIQNALITNEKYIDRSISKLRSKS